MRFIIGFLAYITSPMGTAVRWAMEFTARHEEKMQRLRAESFERMRKYREEHGG
jgi:hypothetical protein